MMNGTQILEPCMMHGLPTAYQNRCHPGWEHQTSRPDMQHNLVTCLPSELPMSYGNRVSTVSLSSPAMMLNTAGSMQHMPHAQVQPHQTNMYMGRQLTGALAESPSPRTIIRQPVLDAGHQSPPEQTMRQVRIDNVEDVRRFLYSRLQKMQQLAGKKIAKNWIKGICPKKQAKFPYQNRIRKDDELSREGVPGWWPPLELCSFKEPDHISRTERMALCLHLLTLRPSPSQLKEMNNRFTEPNPTHVAEGWTAFLKELAGPVVFDEQPEKSEEHSAQRKNYMKQMYDVAALQEAFFNGAFGSKEIPSFAWPADEDDKKPKKKLCSKRSRDLSTDSSDETYVKSEEIHFGEMPRKRSRTSSAVEHHLLLHDHAMQPQWQVPHQAVGNNIIEVTHPHTPPSRGSNLHNDGQLCPHWPAAINDVVESKPMVQSPAMWRRQEQNVAVSAAVAAAAAAAAAADRTPAGAACLAASSPQVWKVEPMDSSYFGGVENLEINPDPEVFAPYETCSMNPISFHAYPQPVWNVPLISDYTISDLQGTAAYSPPASAASAIQTPSASPPPELAIDSPFSMPTIRHMPSDPLHLGLSSPGYHMGTINPSFTMADSW